MVDPALGKIVWYHPAPQDTMEQVEVNGEKQPLVALILCVYEDGLVNLFIFGSQGNTRYLGRVLLWTNEKGEKPLAGYAEWPVSQSLPAGKPAISKQTIGAKK